MSGSRTLARALVALGLVSLSLSSSSVAFAQHALPVEALAFDGLTVQSVRAPDDEGLPVRVVLATAQAARFRVDVWVAASRDGASALLSGRIDTLSTLGLVPRAGLGGARAFATTASGPAPLVALVSENVVLVVRAIGAEDAVPLAAHLAQAVVASAPPAPAVIAAPPRIVEEIAVQEPAGALDWLVTCEGACQARRLGHCFRVARTGEGEASVIIHVVDAFLRAIHVGATR